MATERLAVTGRPMRRLGFRVDLVQGFRHVVWTDEAIAALVGRRITVTFHGVVFGPGTITAATRVDGDGLLGPGVWAEVEGA